jgi:hypothetical protein
MERIIDASKLRRKPDETVVSSKAVVYHLIVKNKRLHAEPLTIDTSRLHKPNLHYPKINLEVLNKSVGVSGSDAVEIFAMTLALGEKCFELRKIRGRKNCSSDYVKTQLSDRGYICVTLSTPKITEHLFDVDGVEVLDHLRQFAGNKPIVLFADNWSDEALKAHSELLKNLLDGDMGRMYNVSFMFSIQRANLIGLDEGLVHSHRFQVKGHIQPLSKGAVEVLGTHLKNSAKLPSYWNEESFKNLLSRSEITLGDVYGCLSNAPRDQIFEKTLREKLEAIEQGTKGPDIPSIVQAEMTLQLGDMEKPEPLPDLPTTESPGGEAIMRIQGLG